jgi:hypothetical protein
VLLPSQVFYGKSRAMAAMPTGSGTSLICVAIDDGVFLAADDLVYVERDGQALPLSTNFRKVCGTERILIGTAGLMVHTDIKYDVQVWVRDFINTHAASLSEIPSSVAEGIFEKLKETFRPAESLVAQDVWKGYLPGDRLVNYVVAGYTKNFKRPYIFEVGVEINRNRDGFAYISPIHHHKALPHNVRFGEDHFMERADAGIEPEHSLWASSVDAALPDVASAFPNITPAFQESVACTVGCIKVEAHFNPQKVGSEVHVALIDRHSQACLSATF